MGGKNHAKIKVLKLKGEWAFVMDGNVGGTVELFDGLFDTENFIW